MPCLPSTVTQTSPTFFLYGEAPQAAEENFLHLEPLDTRSRPAAWHIRPHRHDDLHHIFMLSSGAGEMRADGVVCRAVAPCLLLVPARAVHGFSFVPETTGQVLTIADVLLRSLCAADAELAPLFVGPQVLAAGAEVAEILGHIDRLGRELAWRAPGHAVAVRAALLQIMVAALRLGCAGRAPAGVEGADVRLVARFRALIEARFRAHDKVGTYASALGVSVSRLRQACRRQGCGAPLDMVHARRMLEAKRALLYGFSSVADVAFSLGYDDVSYFVRLFGRLEGVSPRRFRDGMKK